jgi:uncharacterized membrane protein
MNGKTFKTVIAMIGGILAVVIWTGIDLKEPVLPLVALLVAAVAIASMKPKTKTITRDEMMDQLAGKAAKTSMLIFALLALVVGVTLMAAPDGEWADHTDVGYALAYFGSGILIVYSILVTYFTRKVVA